MISVEEALERILSFVSVLESAYGRKSIVGSNPTLSATYPATGSGKDLMCRSRWRGSEACGGFCSRFFAVEGSGKSLKRP